MALRHLRYFRQRVRAGPSCAARWYAVRPQAPNPTAGAGDGTNTAPEPAAGGGSRRPRLGLLFILAGACLATWLIKPTYKLPHAAFDPVRRRVCIVFVFGQPSAKDRATLEQHGFTNVSIDPKTAQQQLEPLVASGHTWLAISGVPPAAVPEFERTVVQCDLALVFGPAPNGLEFLAERLTPVSQPLAEILDMKNM